MGVSKSAVDIVREIIESMNMVVSISGQTTNLDGSIKLDVCSTYYLTTFSEVIIDSKPYKIKELENNKSITVIGDPVLVTEFTLQAIYFFHGSILQTGGELAEIDTNECTPMAYLKRSLSERFGSENDAIEREINMTLFFLSQANFGEWETAEHDTNAIVPMSNVLELFIKTCRKNKYIGLIEGYTTTDRIKFGVVVDKGVEKQYWSKNLSGIELDISLPIRRNFKCLC